MRSAVFIYILDSRSNSTAGGCGAPQNLSGDNVQCYLEVLAVRVGEICSVKGQYTAHYREGAHRQYPVACNVKNEYILEARTRRAYRSSTGAIKGEARVSSM
jgi:hypothetical protein